MVYTISDGPATKKLKQGVSDGVMTITIRGFATTIRNQRLLRYAALRRRNASKLATKTIIKTTTKTTGTTFFSR